MDPLRWIGLAATVAALAVAAALAAGGSASPAIEATADRSGPQPRARLQPLIYWGDAERVLSGSDTRAVFGRSVDGRKLVARRLGPATGRRTSLVVGEIHGDEQAGRKVVRRLRRDGAPRGATLWTVLSVNPDGHQADRRTNAHAVDLNRNFPVGWDGSEPKGSGYYGGSRPLSEPESRALKRLIKRIDPDVTIYYHQPWGAVLLACRGPAPEQKQYARISGLPPDRCRGQRLPGTVTRWQRKRPGTAFVVELEAGGLGQGEVRRHTRAVRALARP